MKNIEKSMSLFAKAGKNYHNKPLLNVFDNKIFHNNENGNSIKWDSNQSLINFQNNSRVVFDKAQKRNFLNFFSKQNKNQEQSFNNESSFKTNNNTTTDESNSSSDSNKNENNKGIAFRSFFYFSSKNNIALMNILIYLLICYTFTY